MKNHTSVLFLICFLSACQSTNNLSPESRSPLSIAQENQVIPLNTDSKIDAQRSQLTRRFPQVSYLSDEHYSEQNFTYEIPTNKILNTKTNTRKRYAPIVAANLKKNNKLLNKDLQTSFNAADFDTNGVNNSGFRFIPADSSAAAGPNHVVNAVNTSIEIYQKDGTQLLSTGLQNFFAILTPLNATFDPRVVYDQRENRWVVITLERTDTASGDAANTSRTLVAVSNTSDPTGSWTMAGIDSKVNISGTDHWLDFPGVGLDEEAIYITGNMFTFGASGSFGGSRLITIDKGIVGGLYAGSSSTFSITDAYNGSIATTHMPAHGFGTMPSGVGTWLVGYSGISNGTNEFIQLIRVDDPLGSPTFTQQLINLGNIDDTSASLNNAPQSGSATEIETNDRRLQDAVWRDGNLWSVMTIDPFSGVDTGQATVFWSQIDTSSLNSPSLLDSGTIGGEDIAAGTFTFFPSIAVNSDGGVAIGFSASHSSIFAGSYFALRSPTDPASTFRSSITLSAGTDTYVRTFGGSQNRWGDYSATVVDNDDSCFWIYNKYATSQGTSINGETGRWATSYGNFCNATPIAQADSITTTQGGTSSILISTNSSVLDNDSDADSNDTLTASLSVDVSAGTLTLNNDGTFSYTHDGSTEASDSFDYFVCDDGSPISCVTQTVDISITGISANTAPVAVNDNLKVDEEGTVTQTTSASSSLLSNDSDPENDNLLLTTTPSSAPSNGSVTLNSNGTFSYTHNGSETTTDSFDYEVCDDGSPSLCDTATVSISINPVNDAPVAVNDSLQVDEEGTVTQTTSASSSL
ncbi:MAG: tandem-95 repeat protein, partial [bacterium]